MRSKLLISLGLVVCLLMAFTLPMCAPAPAPPVEEEKPPVEEPEKKLASSIKAIIDSTVNGEKTAAFIERELGIRVKRLSMSQGETEARIKSEAPNFSVDMVTNAASPLTWLAKAEGWTVPYDSPAWRGETEVYKDPDNNWFNGGVWSSIIVVNTDKLAESGYDAPKGWNDLLDPKWKDEIVMPSALTSGNGWQILFGMLYLYGLNVDGKEGGGWEYLEALDKNMRFYSKSGGMPIELVSRGEIILAIGSPSETIARRAQGWPIEYVVPKEGLGYEGCYSFILKGCEDLYTCQKVIDLMGESREFAEMCATFGWVPKDPTVPSILYGEAGPNYIPGIDLGWAAENRERLCEEWKSRFLRED